MLTNNIKIRTNVKIFSCSDNESLSCNDAANKYNVLALKYT